MMELVAKIKDVRHYGYLPEQQQLGVLKRNGKMILYDHRFSVILKEQVKNAYDFLFGANDKIIVAANDNTFLIQSHTDVHSSKYTIHSLKHNLSIPGDKSENNWYFLTNEEGNKGYVELNNNFEFRRFLPLPMGITGILMMVDNDTFISTGENEFGLFSLQDGSEIWRIDTVKLLGSDNPSIVWDIIPLNGKLYFYLYDHDKIDFKATFCIDAKTGNVLEKFDRFGGYLQLYQNKIYAPSWKTLSILDLATGKTETLEFNEVLKAANLNINGRRCVVQDEYLYFVDGAGRPKDRLAILNIATGQIIWECKIKTTDNAGKCIGKLHVYDGRIFAHASDDTLHIFDKEGSPKKNSLMSFFTGD
ncbi:hypothetical protein CLV59_10645 [Chitinophaga dinghuensis]|uniref:Pyrrolo-quinoline quinone repeat domain-containing protein n=1 Tax=Chitinophaga dinghuensis TaxID=1539050 RepID=A0A327VVK3_9BACT|nr:PQQ-binding-like beta-propeller repeat protein [Chitinophaga dinghuensis]RAJ78985.1 hypothetical protein CLV59_10645 [Chitinophaga dinghuensis]